MIRFILKVSDNEGCGEDITYFKTLDLDVPELEKAFTGGSTGWGPKCGHTKSNIHTLIGVEILFDEVNEKEIGGGCE